MFLKRPAAGGGGDLFPYLYLLSAWGGGVTLRSESDSDTGLRGREAEEVGRDVDQVGTTGEDRGLGSVDTPDRDLEESSKATSQHLPSNLEVVLENIHMENIRLLLTGRFHITGFPGQFQPCRFPSGIYMMKGLQCALGLTCICWSDPSDLDWVS